MTIIGVAGRDGLVVTMDRDEFAEMAGFAGEYALRERVKLDVGTTISVGDVYRKACEALSLGDRTRRAAKDLQECATTLLAFLKSKEGSE